MYFVLNYFVSLVHQITNKTFYTMQTISNIYQIIGAALFLAYAYNVALLIINQLKTK